MKMKLLLALPTAALCLVMGTLPALATPGQWSPGPSLLQGRYSHQAILLINGDLLLAGGLNSVNAALATTEILPKNGNAWAAAATMPEPRALSAMVLLLDGSVLSLDAQSTAEADLYTAGANGGLWTKAADMTANRAKATATLLADGRVLVAGGTASSPAVEIFAPGPNQWAVAAAPSASRYYCTATTLADSRVLVAGGTVTGGGLASAEIYEPGGNGEAGTWKTTASMNVGRQSHTATRLTDGRVLVAGGLSSNNAILKSAEIFNPAANNGQGEWTVLPLAAARAYHTATRLEDGRVLLAGGIDGSFEPLASAEIFDPATGKSTATGALANARSGHTATLLPDGRVLVAGGSSGGANKATDSVEIYEPGPTPTPTTPGSTTPTPTTPGGSAAQPTVAITGKKKITTTKARVKVKGTATGTVTAVLVKVGKKSVKAAGTASWSAKVKLTPGTNKITAVATGPGGPGIPVLQSAPAKVTVIRK